MAFVVVATGCSNKEGLTQKALDLNNLDTTVRPGTDFYKYSTGGWQAANPIPDEYARYGSFDKLRENNEKEVKELIEEIGQKKNKPGSISAKVGDLYRIGMDSIKVNADGVGPIRAQLNLINSAETKEDIVKIACQLRKYANSPFFGVYVGPDNKNSSENILQLYQEGLGMEEREYYLSNDASSKKLREGYVKLVRIQFANAGFSDEAASKAADDVMNIETEIAKSHFEKEKTRIPELNYHKFNVSQLNDSVAAFDWKTFLNMTGAKGIESVNVLQVEPVAAAIILIDKTPVEKLKNYLRWCLIDASAPYLGDNFVNANFDFYGKMMSGVKLIEPRWKRTVRAVNRSLPEAVGQLYVKKYFPAKAKARMTKLVNNLVASLGERIDAQDWMSKGTKDMAHVKLKNFIIKIGYPDKWRDYSKLEIKADSYWANIARSKEFEYDYDLAKLNKPVDKSEWQMSPQTVNAYYDPSTNEICFPAGILQPPFFNMNADDAVNYGGIGVVIGHEMTHGFDDQGRKYDKDGNMKDWWTAGDSKKFDERTKVLVDYFNNIVVLNDVHANGVYTLGENIADHGGIMVSYNAFMKTEQGKSGEKIDGFTPQQRFFLSYGNIWEGNIRDEEILRLTNLDPHSLTKWRVDGTLPHIDAWYDAFHITSKDPMYLPKNKRAAIW